MSRYKKEDQVWFKLNECDILGCTVLKVNKDGTYNLLDNVIGVKYTNIKEVSLFIEEE